MAEENNAGGGGGGAADGPPVKCPECAEGLPLWMGTFSDLVTLLLTFFVLLLSFAKTETSKYKAAMGSIRSAFGGNVQKHGEVIMPGKSPDNSPTMIDSQDPIKPFPIEFLSTEGLLDRHEVNRESDEELDLMKADLKQYDLQDNVLIHQESEGIKVFLRDKIYFKEGSVVIQDVNIEVFEKIVKMMKNKSWVIHVMGHSAEDEKSSDGKSDSYSLSAKRAAVTSKVLVKRGVQSKRIIPVFYGDSRIDLNSKGATAGEQRKFSRRVEFMIRKRDLTKKGRKVSSY
jgi:chemotaxis protein MotB